MIYGAFGTLVGGSSLITIPLLILMGLPPHTAIGTDRMSVAGIGLAGLYSFHRRGMMRYRLAFIVGVPCLVGGFVGANLALQINPELIKKFIVALTAILLIVVMAKPRLGIEAAEANHPPNPQKMHFRRFLELPAGIYGGFYGAGTGTFMFCIMILVFRLTFLESAANMKIAAIMMSATAVAAYAHHGAIDLPLALLMFVGSCIGSYAGARYSDRIGNILIKRIFIGVVLMMVVKLPMDA